MTKHFCDKCGTEINDKTRYSQLEATVEAPENRGGMEVVVMATVRGADVMFCKYCVFDTVARLDDRPRLAQVPKAAEVPGSIGHS